MSVLGKPDQSNTDFFSPKITKEHYSDSPKNINSTDIKKKHCSDTPKNINSNRKKKHFSDFPKNTHSNRTKKHSSETSKNHYDSFSKKTFYENPTCTGTAHKMPKSCVLFQSEISESNNSECIVHKVPKPCVSFQSEIELSKSDTKCACCTRRSHCDFGISVGRAIQSDQCSYLSHYSQNTTESRTESSADHIVTPCKSNDFQIVNLSRKNGHVRNSSTSVQNAMIVDDLKEFSFSNIQNAKDSNHLFQEIFQNHHGCSLLMINALASYLFVGPLVVSFWCSTWIILTNYVFPSNCELSASICMCIGYPILFFSSVFQDKLYTMTTNCRLFFVVVTSRTYSYINSFSCVAQWYGIWTLQECLLGVGSWEVEVGSLICASSLLLLLRCYSQTLSAPVCVQMDTPMTHYYQASTFFMKKPGTWASLPDSFFTVFVVQSLVVTVWKSTWNLVNIFVYPEDPQMSAVVSVAGSYALAFILFSVTQGPSLRLSAALERIHWLPKLVFEDIVTFFYLMVVINHYRGIWMLLELFVPNHSISMCILHGISFLLLTLGFTANSLIVRGCARDGMLTNGQGVVFDIFYLSHLTTAIRAWRKKTQAEDEPQMTSHKRLSIDLGHRLNRTRSLEVRESPETTSRKTSK